MFRRFTRPALRKKSLPALVLVCVSILAYLALIQPWSLRESNLPLRAGDVASQDLRAPHDIRYISDILTEQARAAAERAVAPVYVSPDLTIARSQVEKLTSALQTVTAIRSSPDLTPEQKKAALLGIQELSLQASSVDLLLSLPESTWARVANESINVLDQTMRNQVRTEDLERVHQQMQALVSYTLPENAVQLVVEIASPLVTANSFYSPELTDAARLAARNQVEPVTQSFLEGQVVVRRGQVISDVDLEALSILGLIRPEQSLYHYLGAAILVAIIALFTAMYFVRRPFPAAADLRSLLVISFLFVLFLVAGRVTIPNRTIVPYLIPMPAFALLVSALFGMERGMVLGLMMDLLVVYGMPDSLGLLPYYLLGSLTGVLALGQARRLKQFMYAAVAVAGTAIAVLVAYRLPFTEIDWVGMATLLGGAAVNGIASAVLVLPLQYLLAQFLGITTPLQLLEISRPDSPLLNYYLQRAPGTYQHSLQVANLAEQAAEQIGADTLLTRVGALFHDIGKAVNPLFFIENQPASQIDSHDEQDPEVSAAAIIRHVIDGLELADRYRLPRRLQDFISEHHGTLLTRYQYNRALERVGKDPALVDESKFRYPGPAPRSKETALLMFADGVEARARAENPATNEDVRALVRSVIESRRKDGQLDQAPLSQRDLAVITESFVTTLRVTYHPRLEYPKEIQTRPEPLPDLPTRKHRAEKKE
jgi:putative nucleotidyltransferase with HDIG domain